MKDFKNHIKKESLYHSYIIEGGGEEMEKDLLDFLGEILDIPTVGNPDVFISRHVSFGIDDSHALKNSQQQGAVRGGKKIFILNVGRFTLEAQQALLKVFEEPAPNTHLFIITPSSEALLPTLLSRAQIIKRINDEGNIKEAKKFLNLSLPDRLDYVSKFIKENTDENETQKIREVTGKFLNSLESYLHTHLLENKNVLNDVLIARQYLSSPASSVKLILEEIALTL